MLKCFTANNEKLSLRLADKKAKGQRAGKRDNGKRAANAAAQNNKYYIEIYLEKTKTEKQRTKRAAEAKQIYIFKAHAKKNERKKNKKIS